MDIIQPITFLLDLNISDATSLVLEPALNYENIYQNQFNVFYIKTGVKNKMKMNHLKKPNNILQSKKGCDTWNPTIKSTLKPWEVDVSNYEVMGEYCADEFDEGCMRNLQGIGNDVNNYNATAELSAIEQAMAMTITQSLTDSIYKTAWFSDVNFAHGNAGSTDYIYDVDISYMEPDEQGKLTNMLTVRNGFWSEITAAVGEGKVKYVDSNDGNANGNATLPANVTGFLDDLYDNSSLILKYWNKNRPASEKPVYLVQPGIFRAYEKYLKTTGTEIAHQLIVNGIPVPGVYLYNGYPIMEVPEWDMFDAEIGQISGTQSLYQRALFIAQENLCIASDIANVEGQSNSGIIIQQSMDVRDKGKKWVYAALRFGYGIAHYELVTASYNSSKTYTTS